VLPGVVAEALRTRSPLLLDLAMDLLVPPLSTVALLVGGAVVVEGLRLGVVQNGAGIVEPGISTLLVTAAVAGLQLYVLRGVQLSGLGWRGVLVLAKAPAYVAWKIWLKVRGAPKNDTWVRTTREAETSSKSPP
jgi:hypothetical protein